MLMLKLFLSAIVIMMLVRILTSSIDLRVQRLYTSAPKASPNCFAKKGKQKVTLVQKYARRECIKMDSGILKENSLEWGPAICYLDYRTDCSSTDSLEARARRHTPLQHDQTVTALQYYTIECLMVDCPIRPTCPTCRMEAITHNLTGRVE